MSLVLQRISVGSAAKRMLLEEVTHTFGSGITALVGSNGAGKSTLLRAIATLHPLSAGAVCLDQVDSRLSRLLYLNHLMFMPQTFTAYPDLTGIEFLEYSLRLRGGTGRQAHEIAAAWLDRVGLTHVSKAKIISYSQGMMQRLGMAYTFQVQASAYLLDEPFAGVDPESRSSLMRVLFQISQTAVVIMSTHYVDEVRSSGATIVRIQERTFVRQ